MKVYKFGGASDANLPLYNRCCYEVHRRQGNSSGTENKKYCEICGKKRLKKCHQDSRTPSFTKDSIKWILV